MGMATGILGASLQSGTAELAICGKVLAIDDLAVPSGSFVGQADNRTSLESNFTLLELRPMPQCISDIACFGSDTNFSALLPTTSVAAKLLSKIFVLDSSNTLFALTPWPCTMAEQMSKLAGTAFASGTGGCVVLADAPAEAESKFALLVAVATLVMKGTANSFGAMPRVALPLKRLSVGTSHLATSFLEYWAGTFAVHPAADALVCGFLFTPEAVMLFLAWSLPIE
jgi:hypothetical protein